jgi:hypothetical protein
MSNNYEVVIYLPKPPSLNKLYAGEHWMSRYGDKAKYWKAIQVEMDKIPHFHADSISIHISYNSRFDVDNTIVAIKFLADYLRNHGYIDDDTTKYFTSISSTFDSGLPKGTFVARICCRGYKESTDDQRRTIAMLLHSSKQAPRTTRSNVRGTSRRTGTASSVKRKGRTPAIGIQSNSKKRI